MSSNATAAVAAPESTLTEAEFAQAKLYLAQTFSYLGGAIKGLSETQWKFRPAAGRWSIADNVEHALFVQDYVLGPRRDQLASAPPPPPGYPATAIDDIIMHQFPTRNASVKGPDFAEPSGNLAQDGLCARLKANYDRCLDFLSSSGLRDHVLEGLPLKIITGGKYEWMDGYHWLLAQAAHMQRHTLQILEVKAHPDFPA